METSKVSTIKLKRLLHTLRLVSIQIMQNTAPQQLPIPPVTQSNGLSQRHLALHKDGRTLVDDSNISEGNLKTIIEPLLSWTRAAIEPYGGDIQYFTKISLADLHKKLNNPAHIIGEAVDTNEQDVYNRVNIRPDAGVIMWTYMGTQYPLYIGEDKVQGTNDKLHAAGKPRQATGNAIERYFKNVRAEEMLCAHVSYFPSVVFASGCDFHNSETIAKRLEAGNYGTPNHYIELCPYQKEEGEETDNKYQIRNPDMNLENIIKKISIRKQSRGIYAPFLSIPTVCIKAHKWDELPHNTSLWKPQEYLDVSKQIITLAIQEVIQHHNKKQD
jgi:hypothetical protein